MPPEASRDAPPPSAAPTLRERLGSVRAMPRAALSWARAHKLRAALVALGCLSSVSGLAFASILIATRKPPEVLVALDDCFEALDAGDYREAAELADRLREQDSLPAEDLGGPLYVLGAAAAHDAEQSWPKDRAKRFLLAAKYLEKARNRGFPPGRRAEGLYLLGKSLYRSGQAPASIEVLQEALKANPQRQTEIRRWLAAAYLHDADPKLDRALEENALYLGDKRLSPAARNQGLLQRAQILLRQGKLGQSLATLDQIPANADIFAEAAVVRGQVLLEEARQMKGRPQPDEEQQRLIRQKLDAAVQTLRLAESRDTLDSQATRKAMYLIGLCLLESDDAAAALRQFERTTALYGDTPESLAASLEEADLLRKAGKNAEALAAYRRVLAAVEPERFSNPWISADQLRLRVLAAYQHYLSAQDYEDGLRLSRLMPSIFPRVRALEMTAEVYQNWGQSLLTEAERLPAGKADAVRRQGRTKFRQAGRVYWSLAQLQNTLRQYPDQLWNGASAYFDGQDYRSAIPVLQQYLAVEPRKRRPQALVRLGESLLSGGQIEKALDVLRECAEVHPRDAAAYKARLLAARAYVEKGNLPQAEVLLQENLSGDHITPAGKEWRDSLFALGEVLHAAKRYEEAVRRLSEATERYPEAPQAPEARYLTADAYRRAAQAARDKLQQNASGQRPAQAAEVYDLFQKALEQYRQLQDELGRRQDAQEPTAAEKTLLRNSCFAVGNILFEIGQYEESIKTYAAVANRYQNRPEVLEAYVQMAGAYRQLNKPLEARSTIQQAKVALSRIKPDAPFRETTNYTRGQWSEVLENMTGM